MELMGFYGPGHLCAPDFLFGISGPLDSVAGKT